ncbi:Uncharacterised protein [Acinetobacter baumannii]|nr:Uncharacterised protein [Acinetobacter baumannii]
MFAERVLLQLKVVFLVEVIEPGLSQRYHLFRRRQATQFGVIIPLFQIERMHTAGEGHVVALADQLGHGTVARQRGGDRQHIADVARFGLGQRVVHILVQRLVIQAVKVAMRID